MCHTMCHTTHQNQQSMETIGQMKQRHKLELRKLQSDVKEFQKRAKKERQDKKQIEAKVKAMEDEMTTRHEEEMRSLKGPDETQEASSQLQVPDEPKAQANEPPKPTRAQKRREKKEKQDRERRDRIDEANRNTIKDIPSDGHCMYHAVVDQLKRHPNSGADQVEYHYQQLRKITSEYMRSHSDDFMPFLPLEEADNKSMAVLYEEYCNRVANTSEWGGQLELRALSCALRRPIQVFSADSAVLCIGEEFDGTPLQLTYHLHYYTLGEHFNSVQPSE